MTPRSLAAVAIAALALGASCVHVAEERAERDLVVGHARTGALEVDVEDGLACVRAVEPGALWLRAQAPVFFVRVRVLDGARTLRVRLDNLLPDASVEARDGLGRPVPVVSEPPERVTQRLLVVPVPEPAEVFLTVRAPDADDRAPFRFAVLADVQEAIDRVGEIYAKIDVTPGIRFVLFSGDLTERGTRGELEDFERRERQLEVPLYATLGNHELGADEVWFQRLYGRGSFRFAFRGVQFTLLDSASATIDPLVYDWLDGWLAQARDRVHVVTMHIPPIDPVGTRNGSFASRAEASKLLAMLAAGRVDLTLYGHVHSFYAFANGGIPAYISGGGGAIPERLDGVGRHFLVVDVDPGPIGAEGRVLSVGLVRVDPD